MSLLGFAFMRWAIAAGIVAALACGLIGPFVRVRRLAFLAGAVAHSALAGLGAAQYFGVSPDVGALPAAIFSALLIGWLQDREDVRSRGHDDALIGAVWAVGMAIGILFIARTPGYNVELMSYLFGSILTAGPERFFFMLGGVTVVAGALLALWRPMVAVALDPDFARLRGLPVRWLDRLLLVLVATSVVLLIQVVGLILVLALLTLPAAVGAHWSRSMPGTVLVAMVSAMIAVLLGLTAAVAFDWPAGPATILAAAVLFGLSLAGRGLSRARSGAMEPDPDAAR